ncbi:MAG: hypothetical protein V4631_03565 [Pseudomonadota bacterium]
MRTMLLTSALAALTFSLPASAQDGAAAPADEAPMQVVVVKQRKDPDMISYADVHEKMKKFNALTSRDRIHLRFFAVAKGDAKMADLKLTLEWPGATKVLPVEADGTIEIPMSEQAVADKADIFTNQKIGAFVIHYGPGINVPATTSFRYREVMDGVKQSTSMMKKFWNFLFPSFKGASLRYGAANGQFLVIQSSKGEQRIAIDTARKAIPLELDSDLYDENPVVTVSEKPLKISPFNVSPKK